MRDGRGEGEHVGPGDVVDVDEVAALAAVLEHQRRLAGREAAAEEAGHTGVGRVAGHPRSVDVVVAQGGDGDAVLASEGRAEVLLVELGRGVHVAGIGRRVLATWSATSPVVRSGGTRGSNRPAARSSTVRAAGRTPA